MKRVLIISMLTLVGTIGAMSLAAQVTPVDINTATQQQLEAIPGIGAATAADIIKDRPFKDLADFQAKVKGISNSNFKKMQPYLSFGAATTNATSNTSTTATTNTAKTAAPGTCAVTPINVNKASAQDINTVPGIGDKISAEIVQFRPYKDEADLVKKIKGIGNKNIAKFRACFVY